MFFTHNGVNVIQFGSGDIEISGYHIKDHPEIGTVSLLPCDPTLEPGTEIDRSVEHERGATDEELGVHTRMVFTDTRSIDALISTLLAAKEEMENGIGTIANIDPLAEDDPEGQP